MKRGMHGCCMQVDHVMMQGGDLSNILYAPGGAPADLGCGYPRFENLSVDAGGFDDDRGQITPNSILEDPMHASGGSSTGGSSRKKKSGGAGFFPQLVMSLGGNRRKGAPHRAPLS
jgi:hypothetical protein